MTYKPISLLAICFQVTNCLPSLSPHTPLHALSFTVAQDILCPNITPGFLCLAEVQNSFKTQLTFSCESFGSLKLVDVDMTEKS